MDVSSVWSYALYKDLPFRAWMSSCRRWNRSPSVDSLVYVDLRLLLLRFFLLFYFFKFVFIRFARGGFCFFQHQTTTLQEHWHIRDENDRDARRVEWHGLIFCFFVLSQVWSTETMSGCDDLILAGPAWQHQTQRGPHMRRPHLAKGSGRYGNQDPPEKGTNPRKTGSNRA